MPLEPWKDRWLKLNFTVVGGPHHGMKIPPSHGHRTLIVGLEACGKIITYKPYRFADIQKSCDITVFAPVLLDVGLLELFINDYSDDEYMKNFDPLTGCFVCPKNEAFRQSYFHPRNN